MRSRAGAALLLLLAAWDLVLGDRRYLRHHSRDLHRSLTHTAHGGFKGDRAGDRLNSLSFDAEPTKAPARLFLSPNHTVVLAQLGATATMHCEVTDIGESTVTWIRRRDYQLLTVGLTTYSSDDRFFTAHGKENQDWALHVRFASMNDAGLYECQVSTHPPTSLFVELQLVEAQADIVGGPDKIVKSGSALRLTCVVRKSTEAPLYVFWYQGSRMINFDLGAGAAVRHARHGSELLIPEARKHHAGNYSCVPSNARPASVNVHVLHVEKPAAMQHGSKSGAGSGAHKTIGILGTVLLLICR